MYYLSYENRSGLGWDDIDGVTYLYPAEQPVSCGSITVDKAPGQNGLTSFLVGLLFLLCLGFLLAT